MKERRLRDELARCVDDWGDDFDIDIEQDDYWKGAAYFAVGISHKTLGHDYELTARVGDDGKIEMDFHEDSWRPVNMGNLFAWLWFETAQQRGPSP